MIMFSLTSRATYANACNLCYSEVKKGCGDIPIALCGTKSDKPEGHKTKRNRLTFHRKHRANMTYYETTAMSVSSFLRPILELARKLFGDEGLEITPNPTVEVEEADNCTEGEATAIEALLSLSLNNNL